MNRLKNELLTFLVLGLCFGFCVALFSWDGVVYFIQKTDTRNPAQLMKTIELNGSIKSKKYNKLSDSILLETLIINTEENTIFKFKNLYTANNESICRNFDRIKVQFDALNVSVSGEVPYISIDTDCKLDKNDYLSNLTFPRKFLTKTSLSETNLNINNQKLKLVNIYDQLPETFQMRSVTFYNTRDKASSGPIKIPLKSKTNDLLVKF